MKSKPKILILSGYGLNCEEETKFAFETAGGAGTIVHLNDLIEKPKTLSQFQILAIPGGFSFGDDTGSGKAYANKLKNHLGNTLEQFLSRDTLLLGICNGFQILTHLGLLPGALTHNESARYIDRWVDIKIEGTSPWLKDMSVISLPIAHGEGNYTISESELLRLQKEKKIAATYTQGAMCDFMNLPANPNGAMGNVAGVLGYDGRVLGMMPHPERAMFFTQLPHWSYEKEHLRRAGQDIPPYGPGLQLFKNAIQYYI